jgi:hypothetical protein
MNLFAPPVWSRLRPTHRRLESLVCITGGLAAVHNILMPSPLPAFSVKPKTKGPGQSPALFDPLTLEARYGLGRAWQKRIGEKGESSPR